MRRFWGILAAVPAAVVVATSGAAIASPSADTCTATGSGTSYTINIGVSSANAQQAFAFGAPGVTVTNINVAGMQGTFSTQGLPASTTGQWAAASPVLPGSIVASVTTSGPVKKAFTVVPAGSPPSTFYTKMACQLVPGTGAPSSAFTVDQHITYDSGARAWHLGVTVSGPGTVSGIQAVATAGGSSGKPLATKSLVQSRKVVAKSGGKYTLTLRPTSRGSAALKSSGSLKLKLTVTFNPKDGKPAARVLSLTLKR